jgi:predicted transcriptional regulator
VELTLAGFQQDFPVTDGAQMLGLLTQGDLLRGMEARGKSSPVGQSMQREFESSTPSEALDGALTRLCQGRCQVLMVIERGRVVGLLTKGNVSELLALQAAGRHGEATPARLSRSPVLPKGA